MGQLFDASQVTASHTSSEHHDNVSLLYRQQQLLVDFQKLDANHDGHVHIVQDEGWQASPIRAGLRGE
jgi:hypothetical protein